MPKSSRLPYAKNDRLSDVMAMIQVLGLDDRTHRSEKGLVDELQGVPKSAETWTDVASDHPEFFRVRDDGSNRVSLISRHVVPRNQKGIKPPLEPEMVGKLLTVALDLHDRQMVRAQYWKAYVPIAVPIFVAILTSVGTVLGLLLTGQL